jgi:hypothetical protein
MCIKFEQVKSCIRHSYGIHITKVLTHSHRENNGIGIERSTTVGTEIDR